MMLEIDLQKLLGAVDVPADIAKVEAFLAGGMKGR